MQRELGWSQPETVRQIEAAFAQWRAFRAVPAGRVASLPAGMEVDVRKSAAATFAK
jgi:hypothetical protein